MALDTKSFGAVAIGDDGSVNIGDFSFTAGGLADALAKDDGETLPFTEDEANAYMDVHASDDAARIAEQIRDEKRRLEDKEARDTAEQLRLDELTRLDDLRSAAEKDITAMHDVMADARALDVGPIFKTLDFMG